MYLLSTTDDFVGHLGLAVRFRTTELRAALHTASELIYKSTRP